MYRRHDKLEFLRYGSLVSVLSRYVVMWCANYVIVSVLDDALCVDS